MDGISTLPDGFSYGKVYDVVEEDFRESIVQYRIENDNSQIYLFVDQEQSSYYIWRYFITLKEYRKLKLNEIQSRR